MQVPPKGAAADPEAVNMTNTTSASSHGPTMKPVYRRNRGRPMRRFANSHQTSATTIENRIREPPFVRESMRSLKVLRKALLRPLVAVVSYVMEHFCPRGMPRTGRRGHLFHPERGSDGIRLQHRRRAAAAHRDRR